MDKSKVSSPSPCLYGGEPTEQWNQWLEKAKGLETASPKPLLAEAPGPDRTKRLSLAGEAPPRHPDSAAPPTCRSSLRLSAALLGWDGIEHWTFPALSLRFPLGSASHIYGLANCIQESSFWPGNGVFSFSFFFFFLLCSELIGHKGHRSVSWSH